MVIILKKLKRFGVSGMTLYPIIFLRSKDLKHDIRIMNHERIHIRQQIEMLVLPFYIIYLIEYLFGRLKYKSHFEAYLNISFEREAFINHNNLKYLKVRNFWEWTRYIRINNNFEIKELWINARKAIKIKSTSEHD